MNPMCQIIPVSELQKYCDPFQVPVWLGLEKPISRDEIRSAIQDGSISDPDVHEIEMDIMDPPDREIHIQRVAWFVEHGFDDPIAVDVGVDFGDSPPDWFICDGNHRFASVVYEDLKEVPVAFGGGLDRIDRLFPSFDADVVREHFDD